MAQILDRPGVSEQLYGGIGAGIGGGLSSLIENKVSQLKERQQRNLQASALSNQLNVSREKALAMTSLDPRILQEIVKQSMQAPAREATGKALNALAGNTKPVQPANADQGEDGGALKNLSEQDDQPLPAQGDQGGDGGVLQQLAGQSGQTDQPAPINFGAMSPQQAMQLAQMFLQKQATQQKADQFKALQEERAAKQKQTFSNKMLEADNRANRATVDDLREKTKSASESIRANKDVLRLLKTGKVDTGALFAAKDWADIASFTTSPETQAVAKILAAEPIRSLASIPGQAARLSKVFDTIQKMTPRLLNTEAGLRQIAKIRMAESKAIVDFNNAKTRMLEQYRKKGKLAPYSIDEEVAKSIQPELDKHYGAVERIIARSIGTDDPENLAENFKVGQKAVWDQNGLTYRVASKNGKKFWVPYSKKKG